MKKYNNSLINMILAAVFIVITVFGMVGCGNSGKESEKKKVALVDFLATSTEDVTYGEVYSLLGTVNDEDGTSYILSHEVKTAGGTAVQTLAGRFGIDYDGYVITYTAHLPGGATQQSVVTLNVVGEIPILIQKPAFGIYKAGQQIDISQSADAFKGGVKVGNAAAKRIFYTDAVGGDVYEIDKTASSYTPAHSGVLSVIYSYDGAADTELQIPVSITLADGKVFADSKDAVASFILSKSNSVIEWVVNPDTTGQATAAHVIKWTVPSGAKDWHHLGLDPRVRTHVSSQSYTHAVVYMRVDASVSGARWRPWIGGNGASWWLSTLSADSGFTVGEWHKLEIPAARFNSGDTFQFSFEQDSAFITDGAAINAVYLTGFELISK